MNIFEHARKYANELATTCNNFLAALLLQWSAQYCNNTAITENVMLLQCYCTCAAGFNAHPQRNSVQTLRHLRL